jgi:hypothetical protein
MNRTFQISAKQVALVAGALLLVVLVGGAAYYGRGPQDTGELPVTAETLRRAGSFERLTPRQQVYTRGLYAHDLRGLHQVCSWRLMVAQERGQVKVAADLDRCLRLLDEAVARVEGGEDPTLEQPLIDAVNRALR